ncbi:MAG: hypothetical protein KGJ90_05830 [Patescibacteria group bacterium]|nr:hypothetical protein [Patescibacteria group bacterium]
MLLDTTTKSIKASIEAAAITTNPVYSTTYADIAAAAFTPASSDGALTGTTAVTVVASPAASTQRHVKEIHIYNLDSVTHTITVQFIDGASTFTLAQVIVPAGNFLRYGQETGWQIGAVLGPGTVTSVSLAMPAEFTVAGSPVTSAGTLAITKATQAANTFYAGPTSGAAVAPTFRAWSVNDPLGWGFTAGSIPFMTATGIAQNNASLFWDNVNGRLGLGTTQPTDLGFGGLQTLLHAANLSGGFGAIQLSSSQVTNNSTLGSIVFGSTGSTTNKVGAAIAAWQSGDGTVNASAELRFYVGGINQKLVISASGFVGIGTTSPHISLDVAGPIGAQVYTVATLPSATVRSGQFAFVSDATLTAITGLGLAPTGGGTNFVPVYSDGAGWKII